MTIPAPEWERALDLIEDSVPESTSAIRDGLSRQIGVLNATLRNLELDPGRVLRAPVLIAGGYRIGTLSLGHGRWGFPNILWGPAYWRNVGQRV